MIIDAKYKPSLAACAHRSARQAHLQPKTPKQKARTMNRTYGKNNDLAAVVDRITQQKALDQVGTHADALAQAKIAASRTIDDTWMMYDRGRRPGAHEVIREALEFAKILRSKGLENEAAALCLFAKEQFEALEGK